METTKQKMKTFNVRMPKDLWAFLKKKGVDRETSLNNIIIDLAKKYKEKREKKLTHDDAMV